MLFLNQDIELTLDLRRQHEYLDACTYDDPYFRFNEGSSLMQVVSACGNIQPQPFIPFSDEQCKMSLNIQPGPIPGFDASRLDLSHHMASYHVPNVSPIVNDAGQAKKRASATASSQGSQKSSEGSPMPAAKRSKPTNSVVHTSFRGY